VTPAKSIQPGSAGLRHPAAKTLETQDNGSHAVNDDGLWSCYGPNTFAKPGRIEIGELELRIAVPWSLSHYIPLGGFHPLYRALFDHAPAHVDLIAWDNVKLYRHFARDPADRKRVSALASSRRHARMNTSPGRVAKIHADHVYPPDAILTEALSGELEFHHTAPFPSLTRPFIFHCESFAPIFFPCVQGLGKSGKHEELRLHYQRILSNPLCQGIYSHALETLDGFSNFFRDSAIEAKLFRSRIGLSRQSLDPALLDSRKSLHTPRFLFISPAHQGSETFFARGGHIVLRFWKEFRVAGRDGMLVLRCRRPDDGALALHGVDPVFVSIELGRSILWAEGYLANHEINALMADAHFLLLPGASLDSASILLAMTLGTIPIVTDVPGVSTYVTDREHAIVLKGLRDEIWHLDPDIGILVDHVERMPNVTTTLVTQLFNRVVELLNSKEAFVGLSHRTTERARIEFSGEAFGSAFWDSVTAKAQQSRHSPTPRIEKLTAALQNCTFEQDAWSRVFESSTQPMPLLDTGTCTVAELGGAVVNLAGPAPTGPADWSVFARYYSAGAPKTIFAKTLVELGDVYLTGKDLESRPASRTWVGSISAALMRFPRLHSMVSRSYRNVCKTLAALHAQAR
jgi:glycosyltransferase involved in cell wall biosynthesis